MNRRLILGTLLAVALVGLAAGTARAGPLPDGYMTFVSATPIVYEGTPAWEYYYDVYSGGLGSATQIWLHGFDANELLNPLTQRWDSSAADGWSEAYWGDFPSYGSTDLTEWELSGNPGQMINPIHPPSAYLVDPDMDGAFMYPGDITGANELHYWYGSYVQYIAGLYMTIRLVHPLAPGPIAYSIIGPFDWEQQNAPISGPVAPTGDFDEDDDVDADDIDDLCDNIGGDPEIYDVDSDGDVDEDDLTYLVENLLEWDNGVDTGFGTKQGDFNLDGVVNATDLAIMKGTFGASGIGYADGNANCDDVVNATDLAILKGTFGFVAPTGGGSAGLATGGVPEPATLSLLALGATGLAAKRRRKS